MRRGYIRKDKNTFVIHSTSLTRPKANDNKYKYITYFNMYLLNLLSLSCPLHVSNFIYIYLMLLHIIQFFKDASKIKIIIKISKILKVKCIYAYFFK